MINKFKFLVFAVLVGELAFRYIFSETFICTFIRPTTF